MEPIALVGMSAILPGEDSTIEGFWDMICQRRTARSEVPETRFSIDGFYHRNKDRLDSLNTRHGYFVQHDLGAFDAAFFTTPPAEAACMDPQSRILLETTYHALENAGITMESVAGSKTSVFVAGYGRDYEHLLSRDPAIQTKYHYGAYGTALLSGRISHFFDLRGPNLVLDTACSSSGYAIHLACQSLRRGESTMSIVAGANMILTPESGMLQFSNSGFLSPEGICYSFDTRANGYARGEGFAAIILKPLSEAIRDGDTVRSVIRATGVNQDGRTPSMTQPSAHAQEMLMRDIYEENGLDIFKTGFFEAHGTGTQVGDRVESSAIGAMFRDAHKHEPLLVGAVKSNVGHLEGTSGLVSLIKTTLALETGLIPPNAWLDQVNPVIKAAWARIKFPLVTTPWPRQGLRRASINNFGFGGSNSHIVVEDAFHHARNDANHQELRHVTVENGLPVERYRETAIRRDWPSGLHQRPLLLVLSASDKNGTGRQAKALGQYLKRPSSKSRTGSMLHDLAYTLDKRRTRFPWRSYSILSEEDASSPNPHERFSSPTHYSSAAKLALTFTGQGAKFIHVSRDLFDVKVFQEGVQCCQESLGSIGCTLSLFDELCNEKASRQPTSPALAQILTTCLQIALVDMLASWGVTPCAVVGHSSGEIGAAYAAGALLRDDAVKIAWHRGVLAEQLVDRAEQMGMLAVSASAPECAKVIEQLSLGSSLSIGCINSPCSTTLTGAVRSVKVAASFLAERRIQCSILPTTVAYHSKYMNDIAQAYESSLGDLGRQTNPPFGKPIQMFSTVTGESVVADHVRRASYWRSNMVQCVKFDQAIKAMLDEHHYHGNEDTLFIAELGPYGLLNQPTIESLNKRLPTTQWRYRSMLNRTGSSYRAAVELAGELFATGIGINLSRVNDIDQSSSQVLCDLPGYPFNHSVRYWCETQQSRDFRLRKKGRHELCGFRVRDWNTTQPRWRNIISTRDLPWMTDHKLAGSQPLYPAGGFIVAIVEAVRDLYEDDTRVRSFRLRNVEYKHPILIDDEQHAEWQIHLSRESHEINTTFPWFQFTICSLGESGYTEACCGQVRAETVSLEYQDSLRKSARAHAHHRILAECTQQSDHDQFYHKLRKMGYEYGPFFRQLNSICYNQCGEACASLHLRDWAARLDPKDFSPCIIHPTALDGLLQMPLVINTRGGWRDSGVVAASSTSEVWISSALLLEERNLELSLCAKDTTSSSKNPLVDISAFKPETDKPLVFVSGHATKIIATAKDQTAERNFPTLGFQMTFKPLAEFLEPSRLLAVTTKLRTEPSLAELAAIDNTEALGIYFYRQLVSTGRPKPPVSAPFLEHWLDSMDHLCNSSEVPARRLISAMQLETNLESGEAVSAAEEAVVQIGRHLDRIFRGETTALQIVFETGLADRIYAESLRSLSEQVANLVELLAHNSPALKIIEVGAGTGSVTSPLVNRLSQQLNEDEILPSFSEYTFTDISASFLDPARARFAHLGQQMTFKRLDIAGEIVPGDFELGTYDVLVAASVLHATPKLRDTLRNCRRLLKPGGRLILIEPCSLSRISGSFIFGLIPGWWSSEDECRKLTPLVSEDNWHDLLCATGFSGVDFSVKDHDDPEYHNVSALFATATADEQATVVPGNLPFKHSRILVHQNGVSKVVADSLMSRIKNEAVETCKIITLEQVSSLDLASTLVIGLVDIDGDTIANMNSNDFEVFKTMSLRSARILWISKGVSVRIENPAKAKILGWGRAISAERGDNGFVNICISEEAGPDTIVELAYKAFASLINHSLPQDTELYEHEGDLQVRRLTPVSAFNTSYDALATAERTISAAIGQDATPHVQLEVARPGLLESLRYVESGRQPLAEDEIMIQVHASSLNFADVLIALGSMPDAPLGWDVAGVVTEAGPRSTLQAGDRVMGYSVNALGTFARLGKLQAWPIPGDMSFQSAASVFTVFATAWYSLVHVARITSKDSVLIHSGAGGVGQAALQIAKVLGVTDIFLTVGSDQKKDLLVKDYGIPAKHIFHSRDEAFVPQIMACTDGRGVDVVLNSVSGELLQQTFRCLAPLGRMIEMGKRDIYNNSGLNMRHFEKNVTFSSVNLTVLAQDHPELLKRVADEFMPLFAQGRLREPRPLHIFKASQIEDAFRLFQKAQSAGKVVIDFSPGDWIEYVHTNLADWRFDPEACYLVTGGFGGLGRSVIEWLCLRGAKHVAVVSRSGKQSRWYQSTASLTSKYQVNLIVEACDITKSDSLLTALTSIREQSPPIKGCFNSTMIIQDALVENMSHEAFEQVWRVKADGAWNLFKQLPPDLDFHVQFSSCVGIVGAGGQSNYIVGSTFQDALAEYAADRGRHYINLNLGVQSEAGFVAENSKVSKMLARRGFFGISSRDFLKVLEVVCDPRYQNGTFRSSQLVLGLDTPHSFHSKGLSPPDWMFQPTFSILNNFERRSTVDANPDLPQDDLAVRLKAAKGTDEIAAIIVEELKVKLARTMMVSVDEIDVSKPGYMLGVDSLIAVELRSWLLKQFNVDVSVFDLQQNQSTLNLCRDVAKKLDH